jgi:hypothetical protein
VPSDPAFDVLADAVERAAHRYRHADAQQIDQGRAKAELVAICDVLADGVERPVDQLGRHRIGLGTAALRGGEHVADGDQLGLGPDRVDLLGVGVAVAVGGTLDGIYEGVEAWVI